MDEFYSLDNLDSYRSKLIKKKKVIEKNTSMKYPTKVRVKCTKKKEEKEEK